MNKFILRFVFTVFCFVLSAVSFAQDAKPEMADMMRNNGKIYVVVAVCLTILIGLFIYVFLLDRKISRLEKGKDSCGFAQQRTKSTSEILLSFY